MGLVLAKFPAKPRTTMMYDRQFYTCNPLKGGHRPNRSRSRAAMILLAATFLMSIPSVLAANQADAAVDAAQDDDQWKHELKVGDRVMLEYKTGCKPVPAEVIEVGPETKTYNLRYYKNWDPDCPASYYRLTQTSDLLIERCQVIKRAKPAPIRAPELNTVEKIAPVSPATPAGAGSPRGSESEAKSAAGDAPATDPLNTGNVLVLDKQPGYAKNAPLEPCLDPLFGNDVTRRRLNNSERPNRRALLDPRQGGKRRLSNDQVAEILSEQAGRPLNDAELLYERFARDMRRFQAPPQPQP